MQYTQIFFFNQLKMNGLEYNIRTGNFGSFLLSIFLKDALLIARKTITIDATTSRANNVLRKQF